MPLGKLEGQPKTEFSFQEALSMARTKNRQLMFEMDILRQQLNAFEQENNALRKQLEDLQKEPE